METKIKKYIKETAYFLRQGVAWYVWADSAWLTAMVIVIALAFVVNNI